MNRKGLTYGLGILGMVFGLLILINLSQLIGEQENNAPSGKGIDETQVLGDYALGAETGKNSTTGSSTGGANNSTGGTGESGDGDGDRENGDGDKENKEGGNTTMLFVAASGGSTGGSGGSGGSEGSAGESNESKTSKETIVAPICEDNDDDGYDTCDASDPNDTDGLRTDCDDNDPEINPGEFEICGNGKDDNCDGVYGKLPQEDGGNSGGPEGNSGDNESLITCQEDECGDLDQCPEDPDKTEPGTCGCGIPDTDSDGDGTPDCNDENPGGEKGIPVPEFPSVLLPIIMSIGGYIMMKRKL